MPNMKYSETVWSTLSRVSKINGTKIWVTGSRVFDLGKGTTTWKKEDYWHYSVIAVRDFKFRKYSMND